MKKALNIIKNVLVWTVVAVAVLVMIFTIISTTIFNRSDRSLFGFRIYTVLSDSMAKTDFDAGSVIFSKEVDPTTLKEGDIISYISQRSENFGEVITHKIRSKTVDDQGNPGFITYGTTTGADDPAVITYPYITGKYVGHIPAIGHFFQFLKTPQGYFSCIFIPFALLILYQGIKCIKLFRRYKSEQMDELQAEKDRIEQERAENARVLAELQALKAQMSPDAAPASAPPVAEAPEAEAPAQAEAQPSVEAPETDA